MLAGIGSVFVFLVLLMVATRLLSWALMHFVPSPPRSAADTTPDAHLAVIAAAVNRYRKERST